MNHISEKVKKELGAVLRAARKAQGLPLDVLAKKIGIHKDTIATIEKGGNYSVGNLIAYANLLGFQLNIAPNDDDYPHKYVCDFTFEKHELDGIEATTEGVKMFFVFVPDKKGYVLSQFQSAETDLEKVREKIRIAADILAVVPLERLLEK